jgi:hypothetical protein
MAALDLGMYNVTAGDHGYRFHPHGARFKKALRLSVSYDRSRLPPGMTEQDIYAFYFDESQGRWIILDRVRVDTKSQQVVSLTDHFTDVITATITVPTHPEVSSYNPNTIRDLRVSA